MLATFSPKSYLLICNYVPKRRHAGYHPVTPFWWKLLVFVFFVFRGWQGQSVGQSAWPSTQPTGLARQLRQSARSTAHFHKIRKTKKPESQKKQHMYRNWEAVSYPFWWKLLFFIFFLFSGLGLTSQSASPPGHPLTQPTGLASQLRQSARSTAHFHEIRKTRKPKNQHMYRNWEAVAYPFWWKLLFFSFFDFLFFRGWPGQPVGQSAWPSTQPTGLASQLRQSARSTAHSHEIRKTQKPEN